MFDPRYTTGDEQPKAPNGAAVQRLLFVVTCLAVIAGVVYFIAMDRSDRAAAQKRAIACDRDRSFVSTMEALGSRDNTVYEARQRLSSC